MSDVDVRRALQVISRHGAIRSLMELARDEKLTYLSNDDLEQLEAHIKFLRERRTTCQYFSGDKPHKAVKYVDMTDEQVLKALKAANKFFLESPFPSRGGSRRSRYTNIATCEAEFRGILPDQKTLDGSKKELD